MKPWRFGLVVAGVMAVLVVAVLGLARSGRAGGPELPTAKREALAAEEWLLAAARAMPAAPKPAVAQPPADGGVRVERTWGILPADVGPVPVSAQQYRVENKWLGEVDGQFTAVYAAVSVQGPAQAVLIRWQPDAGKAPEVFPLAAPAGTPRIVAVGGRTISLTVGGVPASFDLP